MSQLSFAFGFAQPLHRLVQLPEGETVRAASRARQLALGPGVLAIGHRQFHSFSLRGGNGIASFSSSSWIMVWEKVLWRPPSPWPSPPGREFPEISRIEPLNRRKRPQRLGTDKEVFSA